MIRLPLLVLLVVCAITPVRAQTPAGLISAFRAQHGEGAVVADGALTRVAREQAVAMAKTEVLDHDVLGAFSKRVAPAGAAHAAENIAYGHDSFPKTLSQWIASSGHRQNLLMRGATRVGVASARSPAGRTYWAMVIAAGSERPKAAPAKSASSTKSRPRALPACRIKILQLCL